MFHAGCCGELISMAAQVTVIVKFFFHYTGSFVNGKHNIVIFGKTNIEMFLINCCLFSNPSGIHTTYHHTEIREIFYGAECTTVRHPPPTPQLFLVRFKFKTSFSGVSYIVTTTMIPYTILETVLYRLVSLN